MSRHPELRNLVHLERPNLHLQRLLIWPNHLRVKRLVTVRLRSTNVVVKQCRHGQICLVNHAQRQIAVANLRHDDPQRKKIINLLERNMPLHHLVENRVQVLGTTPDIDHLKPTIFEFLLQDDNRFFQLPLAVTAGVPHQLANFRKFLWMKRLKRQIFKLPLDLPDS